MSDPDIVTYRTSVNSNNYVQKRGEKGGQNLSRAEKLGGPLFNPPKQM